MKIRKRKRRRISLRLIPISKLGYDATGHYWGKGDPLFAAEDLDTGQGTIFRAANRQDAVQKIQSEIPKNFKRKY